MLSPFCTVHQKLLNIGIVKCYAAFLGGLRHNLGMTEATANCICVLTLSQANLTKSWFLSISRQSFARLLRRKNYGLYQGTIPN